jgi:putative ABC transport system ATP-binding protein
MKTEPNENEAAIECCGVERAFRDEGNVVPVLRGLDLSVRRGELTLITGPSGCGKTTLLGLMGGLLRGDAGELRVLGTEVASLNDDELVRFRRRNVGYVFQEFHLLPALTAIENVMVPLIIQGERRREALERAGAMLEEVGMGAFARVKPAVMSVGQRQRIAIARALVHGPRVVLCDEPTAALDHGAGRLVMGLLRAVSVRADRAVVVVTHDPRIYEFGDAVAEMDDGRVTAMRRQAA